MYSLVYSSDFNVYNVQNVRSSMALTGICPGFLRKQAQSKLTLMMDKNVSKASHGKRVCSPELLGRHGPKMRQRIQYHFVWHFVCSFFDSKC